MLNKPTIGFTGKEKKEIDFNTRLQLTWCARIMAALPCYNQAYTLFSFQGAFNTSVKDLFLPCE